MLDALLEDLHSLLQPYDQEPAAARMTRVAEGLPALWPVGGKTTNKGLFRDPAECPWVVQWTIQVLGTALGHPDATSRMRLRGCQILTTLAWATSHRYRLLFINLVPAVLQAAAVDDQYQAINAVNAARFMMHMTVTPALVAAVCGLPRLPNLLHACSDLEDEDEGRKWRTIYFRLGL